MGWGCCLLGCFCFDWRVDRLLEGIGGSVLIGYNGWVGFQIVGYLKALFAR